MSQSMRVDRKTDAALRAGVNGGLGQWLMDHMHQPAGSPANALFGVGVYCLTPNSKPRLQIVMFVDGQHRRTCRLDGECFSQATHDLVEELAVGLEPAEEAVVV